MTRLRLSRLYSSASSGVKKNVSSESDGRSDHPLGDPGTCSCVASFVGRASSNSRASYLDEDVSREGSLGNQNSEEFPVSKLRLVVYHPGSGPFRLMKYLIQSVTAVVASRQTVKTSIQPPRKLIEFSEGAYLSTHTAGRSSWN